MTRGQAKLARGRVVAAAVAAQVAIGVAHVLFVALYSHLMAPHHDVAYYRQFAQETGPPFVTLTGPMLVFLIARRLLPAPRARAWGEAGLLCALLVAFEIAILAVAGRLDLLTHPANALALPAKLAGAILALAPWRSSSAVAAASRPS